MKLAGLRYHVRRLRRELGQPLNLGGKGYRVRGYFPNHLTTDFRHERHLIEPLKRAVAQRQGLFIDVGVNTGQTLLKMLSIAPEMPYLGFEPQIGCAFLIDQFLRDNNVNNASVLPIALSDTNGMLPIFSVGQFDEMASLVLEPNKRATRKSQAYYISARIGDEVLTEIGIDKIAILKVDVEGAEINVFRGLQKTIYNNRPICFFEVLPNFVGKERTFVHAETASSNRETAALLFRYFLDAQYQLFQINSQGDEVPIYAFDLDTPDQFVSSDYVAYPTR